MLLFKRQFYFIWLVFFLLPTNLNAGFLMIGEVSSSQFGMRDADGSTRSYSGYGPKLSLGYGIKDLMDFTAWSKYQQAGEGNVDYGRPYLTRLDYGGSISARFLQNLFIRFDGGLSQLTVERGEDYENYGGNWAGQSGSVGIGSYHMLSKQSLFQFGLYFGSAVVKGQDLENEEQTQRVETISLNLGVGFHKNGINSKRGLFGSFLGSLKFW